MDTSHVRGGGGGDFESAGFPHESKQNMSTKPTVAKRKAKPTPKKNGTVPSKPSKPLWSDVTRLRRVNPWPSPAMLSPVPGIDPPAAVPVAPLTDSEISWLRAFITLISGAPSGAIPFTEDSGLSLLLAATVASHAASAPGVNSGLPFYDPT